MKIKKQEIILRIVDLYQKNVNQKELAKIFHVSPYSIKRVLKSQNILIRGQGIAHRFFLKEDEDKIRALHGKGLNFVEISKEMNCSDNCVARYCKRLGLASIPQTLLQRKHSINENFFDNPLLWEDEHAYWLGWLLSDGYLNKKRNSISFGLQYRDKDVLNNLKKIIGYSGKLSKRNSKDILHKNKIYQCQKQATLTIGNKKICEDLCKLMNFKNKTFNLKFPEFLNDKLFDYFLLGFWEGDGCLSFDITGRKIQITIVSTGEMCGSLKEKLKKFNINSNIYFPKQYKHKTCVFRISSRLDILKFLNLIYKRADIMMKRKFKKYQNLIKLIIEKGVPIEDPKVIIEAQENIKRINDLKTI